MIVYYATGPFPSGLSSARVRKVAAAMAHVRGLPSGTATIGLRFVTVREIQRLNRMFRGKNKPTDVLSFGMEAARGSAAFPSLHGSDQEIGDLVVCPSVARAEARRRSMDPVEELVRLIVHGTLHLAGMDHATAKEEERMFALQEHIVAQVMNARTRIR